MERISTIVIQKALDAFFVGLDVVDNVRRRVDRLLGRPDEDPFMVVWPDETQADADAKHKGNGDTKAEVSAEPAPKPAASKSKKAASKTAKPARTGSRAGKKAPTKAAPPKATVDKRPKVAPEIEDLAIRVKDGALGRKALDESDEVIGKRMLARVVYVLGVADAADLGALTSTEVAHVLSVGCNIETFGTNISRAIRQGTQGLIEEQDAPGKDPKRYALSNEGRAVFDEAYTKA